MDWWEGGKVKGEGGGAGHTVVVGILEVLVDNTTGKPVVHLRAVHDGDVAEGTRLDGDTTVLGEEVRDGVVAQILGHDVVAGLGVGGVTAPLVDIVTEEVDGFVRVTAVEVVDEVGTDLGDISSGVTDTDGAVVLGLDVGLHVTHGGLDVGTGTGGVDTVGVLVTREEAQSVGVVGQRVDYAGVVVVQVNGPLRVAAVNGVVGGGQIRQHVDTCVGEQVHTGGVVRVWVDVVDTHHVGVEFLQVGQIPLADGLIGEGIDEIDRASGGRRAVVIIGGCCIISLRQQAQLAC